MAINRQQVHAKYGGHCAYCGQQITLKAMQVDHIWPKHVGGTDDPDNLTPSCRQCNHYKRGQSLHQFRITMQGLHERVQKIYIHKVAVNFGMATITPWDGKFYYERATHSYAENAIQRAVTRNPSDTNIEELIKSSQITGREADKK